MHARSPSSLVAAWDAHLDRRCATLAHDVCDAARPAQARDAAWKELLVALAPHVEEWAARNRVLRRAGLATEDDVRAVLVALFARLGRNDFENLRTWLARRAPASEVEAGETEAIERLVRLAAGERADPCGEPAPRDDDEATPLRGWLLNLLRFVVKDHVKQRLGWGDGAGEPGVASKRDLGTNAERLDDAPEPGARPPLTDLVALRRLMDEIRRYVDTFPAPMKAALDLWMQDTSFEEIAARLGLESADAGRALARAAQARLRERFRGAWPDVAIDKG